jgi:flagellar biosynthesis/type III secretory pathway M-ring protein FliF/YscJ
MYILQMMHMNNLKNNFSRYPKKIKWFLGVFIFSQFLDTVAAQVTDVPKPHENEPIALDSWSEVIIYIVLPAILIILYLIILYHRRKKKKEQQEREEQQKDKNN